ncbi:hypothetical protein CBW46_010100 [Paenibacillus xerothermodurans]|uniref:Uncharacterized protein n=1 Tax=Paenibacillus xerothermodurans TaxID=1977292 RepID=A0A2W1NNI9_PAEXE|nr:hypothetical protein CBW46_010100 [Paenibacillus xerothermodurans]
MPRADFAASRPRSMWTADLGEGTFQNPVIHADYSDPDGNAYLVHAFAHSPSGIKHKLQLCRMSADGRNLLDEGVMVCDGTTKHPTLEGPKMYKRNGYSLPKQIRSA